MHKPVDETFVPNLSVYLTNAAATVGLESGSKIRASRFSSGILRSSSRRAEGKRKMVCGNKGEWGAEMEQGDVRVYLCDMGWYSKAGEWRVACGIRRRRQGMSVCVRNNDVRSEWYVISEGRVRGCVLVCV